MKARPDPNLFPPDLGLGLGFRSEHTREVLELNGGRPSGLSWFEAVSENYMKDGGRPLSVLERIRRDFPVVLHGVSLSIGSVDPLDRDYLKRLKALVDRIDPAMLSDHCCWAGVNGQSLHDLVPLPFTREAIRHVAERVARVQDFLGRRILLENVSSYITFTHSEMTEWEFLAEIARRADCGILLDVNNVYVSSVNHGFDPVDYLSGIPTDRIGQIHLAGHSRKETEDGHVYLIDTHDHPVCDEVWELYAKTLQRHGDIPTMIEWDAEIPSLARLLEEMAKAGRIRDEFRKEVSGEERELPGAEARRASALAQLDHHGA